MENTSRIKRYWLWCPRWLRVVLLAIASVVTLCLLLIGGVWWYVHPSVDRTDGVVYGQRLEKPLALDVIRPSNANGYGVAVMVSGSWKSGSPGELRHPLRDQASGATLGDGQGVPVLEQAVPHRFRKIATFRFVPVPAENRRAAGLT